MLYHLLIRQGPTIWLLPFISSVLVSASLVSLDVRFNSTVIQFIQTSPPLEGYYSHINSLLLFFPLYISSTSFKTYRKDSVAGNPKVYSSSNGIKVYYFLLIQSPKKCSQLVACSASVCDARMQGDSAICLTCPLYTYPTSGGKVQQLTAGRGLRPGPEHHISLLLTFL